MFPDFISLQIMESNFNYSSRRFASSSSQLHHKPDFNSSTGGKVLCPDSVRYVHYTKCNGSIPIPCYSPFPLDDRKREELIESHFTCERFYEPSLIEE